MKSGGGSSAHVGMYVGEDWWTFLSTYDDHTPILDVTCGSTTVSLSVADRKTGAAAVEFARELADKAAKFAAEVERLHAQATATARTAGPARAAGMVRRPDGNRGWGGRNGHSCRPGCLPLLAHAERS